MASSLPNNPSLDRLRAEARELQAVERCSTPEAELRVARRYGFSGWPALAHYLTIAGPLTVDPGGVDEAGLEGADRFCALASLRYDASDAPPRWQAAAELMHTNSVVYEHVWAAASAGDVPALQHHLAEDAGWARARGGPFGWEPLLYLCYSRVPLGRTGDNWLSAARLLLDAGADPNAGYLWCGLSTPFTALTGVFGEGEQGPRRQPRHPFAPDLAALLLARGAHPVDQQTLYNRMFRRDDSHLEQLFGHGLADAGPSPWELRLGEAMESRAQMWQRQVDWAVEHGFTDRLELLARNGIGVGAVAASAVIAQDPNALDDMGATPLHHAAWDGDLEVIRTLLDAGADPTITDARFQATPLGWAEHAYQTEAAELLRAQAST
ncbi:ankyrin repeat domain-containing protein [Mycolicibacterium arenosum]|uniref:Ankyrin n=1 Tax=Mycolicibacterium arenosum TaxID=2952157 RepID=A0ABT1M2Q6_9MYCO|nr:ankyrin repeat domain-containing protein [Mycolicibacterium sp. CAU 1645]MCP9273438.1 hypothetical protein [Mycolicibacterium sp. CAU 1645]